MAALRREGGRAASKWTPCATSGHCAPCRSGANTAPIIALKPVNGEPLYRGIDKRQRANPSPSRGSPPKKPLLGLLPLAQPRLKVLTLGALALACGEDPAPADIEIGVVLPFADAVPMQDARRAWELVLDELEAAGGVGGRQLSVSTVDVALSDPADLAPVTQGFVELTRDGCKYIISTLADAELEPTMSAALPANVLAMSVTAEASTTNLPTYDGMLLRGIMPTDRLISEQAERLRSVGFAALGLVGETRAGVADARYSAMLASYTGCAGCRTTSATYPAEADLYAYDWSALGASIAAGAPDVVFLATANPDALIDSVRAIEVSGYTGLYYFAYGAYMSAIAPIFAANDVALRFRSFDLALPASPELDRFLEKYSELHGEMPIPEPRLLAFADYMAVLALSMTAVGSDDARQVGIALRDIAGPPGERFGPMDFGAAMAAVRDQRDIDYAGLSGSFDFDARGEALSGFVQEYGVDASGNVHPL